MNHTPDFSPLTPRQLALLEEIKAEKEKLRNLPPGDPETGTRVPDFYGISNRIDDLSVKALRSGLLRGRPAESRRHGFRLKLDSHGEYEDVLPGFGDFHPELPLWAVNHFVEWIQMLRLRRHDARDFLRATKIVGIETGMKRPEDLTLLARVLDLRGFEGEGNLTEKQRKRTRKERNSWDWVIGKLVEEGLLPRKITHQALKKMLKNRYPEWPWEAV
jgi:hypothetical protein